MSEPSRKDDEKISEYIPGFGVSPQIHVNVLPRDDEGAAAAAAVVANQVDGATEPPLLDVPVATLPDSTVKSRQPHVLKDEYGNEKKYGSALGLLTRKFVDLIHVSHLLVRLSLLM